MSDTKRTQAQSKDPARMAVLRALELITTGAATLDDALNTTRSRLKDPRDRAFHHQLVMTVMRHFGEIETVLDAFLQRKPRGRAAKVVYSLQLGIAQVLYLDVPGYAAASTTVDLVRQSGLAGHAKLVNAIMRRVAEHGPQMLETLDAAKLNTPPWLWEIWSETYGIETCRAIAGAHALEPKLDISTQDEPAEWAEALGGEVLPSGSVRLSSGGMIEKLDGYEEGHWWVQDAAAALPVRLLGDVNGKSIADLCAAPGGKTMQLASRGAIVTAVDRSKKRLKVLHRNLYRTHLKASVITANVENWEPEAPFDGVLLDAPCSATGTLRRHPDIVFQKGPEDVASLSALQDSLLDAAVAMTKPGGLIVYCTCSLQPEEGIERIASALARNLPVEVVPISEQDVPGLHEAITPEGYLRTLPCHWFEKGGMDGFFAARLRKL